MLDLVRKCPSFWAGLDTPCGQYFKAEQVNADFPQLIDRFAVPEPFWVRSIVPVVQDFGVSLEGFQLPWALGATGNLSVARDLVEKVGRFDEAYKGWGLEDADLHYRLHREGAATIVSMAAENYHQCHERPVHRNTEWVHNASYFLNKFGALEIPAYLCALFGRRAGAPSLVEMSQVLTEHAENPTESPKMRAELARLMRDHARLCIRAATVME